MMEEEEEFDISHFSKMKNIKDKQYSKLLNNTNKIKNNNNKVFEDKKYSGKKVSAK